MESFLVSCVALYTDLAPKGFKLKEVPTPFSAECQDDGPAGNPAPKSGNEIHCPWCQASFPATLNVPLPKHRTKTKVQDSVVPDDDVLEGKQGGELQPYAAKVLMKLLYGARLARFDLLRAINDLAAYITKWTPDCDKRLHRIMCYVHSTLKHRLVGFVGDKPEQLRPHLFSDAEIGRAHV